MLYLSRCRVRGIRNYVGEKKHMWACYYNGDLDLTIQHIYIYIICGFQVRPPITGRARECSSFYGRIYNIYICMCICRYTSSLRWIISQWNRSESIYLYILGRCVYIYYIYAMLREKNNIIILSNVYYYHYSHYNIYFRQSRTEKKERYRKVIGMITTRIMQKK